MKKIKIIDLFIKIANGGKIPKKIKYNGKILNLDNSRELRYRFENDTFLSWDWFMENRLLNEEVEIIEYAEEDEGIKKVDTNIPCSYEIETTLRDKLNEVIDTLNRVSKRLNNERLRNKED